MLGQGEGMTPSTRGHPSLLALSQILVPLLAPQVLGPSKLMEPASPSWEALSEYRMLGRGLPYSEVPRRDLGGMDSG